MNSPNDAGGGARDAADAVRPGAVDRAAAQIGLAELQAAVRAPVRGALRGDFDLNPGARAPFDPEPDLRPAAVLCGVIQRPGGLNVILTRRAEHLSEHAGQVAFPGGKIEAGDASPLAAALREAEEEIGLAPDLVGVLGAIDPYRTSTGFHVTPFVGLVDPGFRPVPDRREVAAVFEAPLAFLMDPANRQLRSRVWRGAARAYYAIPFREHLIWGATAGMLKALSDRLRAARR